MALQQALNRMHFESARLAELERKEVSHKALMNALDTHINGDHDGAIREIESLENWINNALAQRIYGHALLGKKEYLKAANAHKAARHLNEGDVIQEANDEINLAAVQIATFDYSSAWETYERAYGLAKGNKVIETKTKIGKICILNRKEQHDLLKIYLLEILSDDPAFFNNPTFINHLDNDSDFMGVNDLLVEIIGDDNV